MMVKDYVAFYGGVMIKYVWLSNLQFEEISIYSWRCFLKATDPRNNNPVSILEHPHVYTLGEICSGAIFTHTTEHRATAKLEQLGVTVPVNQLAVEAAYIASRIYGRVVNFYDPPTQLGLHEWINEQMLL
jgi:hypothetical protein